MANILIVFISNSSSFLTRPLRTIRSTPIISGITVVLIFHNFFSSLARSKYLTIFPFSLIFTALSTGRQTSLFGRFSLFRWLSFGQVIRLWFGDHFLSQNPRKFCVSYSPGRILGCAVLLVHVVKYKFLAHFSVDHLPHLVVSSLVLFFAQVFRICLLCGWSFPLHHHITYTWNSFVNYLFSL